MIPPAQLAAIRERSVDIFTTEDHRDVEDIYEHMRDDVPLLLAEIDALRGEVERAKAATQAEWASSLDRDGGTFAVDWREIYSDNGKPVVFAASYDRHNNGETETHCGVRIKAEDAEHIAAFSPPTVLALLAAARCAAGRPWMDCQPIAGWFCRGCQLKFSDDKSDHAIDCEYREIDAALTALGRIGGA